MERKIIYLEWEDITQSDPNWRDFDEALDWAANEVSIVKQVGFLLDKDENYITLICSYMGDELAGTVIRIPAVLIKHYKELT